MIYPLPAAEAMTNNTLIVDCDGVLLDWLYEFHTWISKQNYVLYDKTSYSLAKSYGVSLAQINERIDYFNKNFVVEKMINGAHDALSLFHANGWNIRCVTSFSQCSNAMNARKIHLQKKFNNVFDDICVLPLHHSKRNYLTQFAYNTNTIYVEDNIKNVDDATQLGIQSYLLKYPYNQHYNGIANMVNNWQAISQTLS